MTGTVLVVEDDPAIGELFTDILKSEGISTMLAHSGGEALHLAGQMRPDALVLDLGLPDADGTKVAKTLCGVPVVIVSAQPTIIVAASARSVHAVAYLTKPFDVEDLIDAVQLALNSEVG